MKKFEHKCLTKLGLEIRRTSSPEDQANDPIEFSSTDERIWSTVRPHTMTGRLRVFALIQAVRHVVENDIEGDFVECGVWRGGSAMAIASVLVDMGVTDRRIWLYDTFEGMTSPTLDDVEVGSGTAASHLLQTTPRGDGNNVWASVQLQVVKDNMRSTGHPKAQFLFVQGDISLTIHEYAAEKVALLRMDTDWYVSTKIEMNTLCPLLSQHGVCIVDDFGHWAGSLKVVEEYF